ncbi:MAG: hypothetical protein K0R11_18 [Acidimicrobiales bacterium]|nr:hypothetical protein [Acidimicrobiales bacterium]
MTRRRVALGLVTSLWCVLGLAVLATYGGRVTADEPQYLLSATSLVEDGDLDIADELADERWRDYHEAQLPEQTKPLDDGRRLSPHDPLLPVLLAVPVALGGWVGAKLFMAGVAGALAVALVAVARRLGVDERRALLAGACFALVSPFAVYGTQLYPELVGALVVTGAAGALLALPSMRGTVGVVAAVAVLPWLSVKYAPVAAALGVVGLVRLALLGHLRRALALAAGLGGAAAVCAAGHLAIYDALTPYAVGDHFTGGELTVMGTSPNRLGRTRRLLGLVVDRDFGLAAWAPGWLLLLPALGAMARDGVRRRAPEALVIALPLAAGWAVATWVALTMHGYWWSGRQVVVVLPLAVLAVARWGPPARWLVAGAAAGALNYAWLAVEGLAGRLTWVVDPWRTTAPVMRALRPLLPDLAHPGWLDEVRWCLWIAAAAALVASGWRRLGRDEDAAAREGPQPDHPLVDVDRHRAVR